ncbi:hypothetical protein OAO60_00865 [bacterium]|nr:hypothetical protein [bacterium]
MLIEKLRRYIKKLSLFFNYSSNLQVKELIYFQSLLNMLPKKVDLHPFGGSANSSLLYFLGRFCKEHTDLSILELGMGQTTLLLNSFSLNQKNHIAYDDNEFWVQNIKSKLMYSQTSVLNFKDLERVVINKHNIKYYQDLNDEMKDQHLDLVIVDGPKGSKKLSRSGIIPLLIEKFTSQDNLVVIFDDTHRKPEFESFELLIKMLKQKKQWDSNYKIKFINASKSQACIIKGKKYLSSYYY